jgi:hypothetical protein
MVYGKTQLDRVLQETPKKNNVMLVQIFPKSYGPWYVRTYRCPSRKQQQVCRQVDHRRTHKEYVLPVAIMYGRDASERSTCRSETNKSNKDHRMNNSDQTNASGVEFGTRSHVQRKLALPLSRIYRADDVGGLC